MPKKKKTRKQKEKAQQRRLKTLAHVTAVSSSADVTEKDTVKSVLSPTTTTANDQEQATTVYLSVNQDLRKVLILVGLFASLLVVLVMTEAKYHYLTPLADKIINFLLNV